MSKSTFKGSLLATTVIAGIAVATPAFAQNQTVPETAPPAPVTPTDTQGNTPPAAPGAVTPAPGVQTNESAAPAVPTSAQEIVITGTLIRNPNLVASAPVSVVGQDEIRLRQSNTAEEVLRTIPGAAPSSSAQVNNGNVGASFVNLRSIGTNRNIVLLDGVRVVPFDQLLRVDLNIIPLALVDRVDVLTGGASSTYGADAVAGVINFITRNDFSGMELQVSDGITQRGDGNYLRGDLTLGANFDDGRGNAVISLGYQESDPVFQGHDRPWSDLALASSSPGNLRAAGSSTTTPTAFDTNSGRLQVNPTGTNIVPFYQPFNFNPYNVFQTPFQRYNLYGAAHYDITDHLTIYGRGLFSSNQVKTIIAPSGDFGTTANIPLNNPFLTQAQSLALCQTIDTQPGVDTDPTRAGIQDTVQPPSVAACTAAFNATGPTDPNYMQVDGVGIRRRTPEVGPRISNYRTNTWDFRVGVRGDITDKIGFDLWGARGTSDSTQHIQNYALTSHFQQGLLVHRDATGNVVCDDPSNGCVPVNLFGPSGSITPEMATFLRGNSTIETDVKLSQARGTINGDTPLQLWAKNPVSFAVGAEYRKYTSHIAPDFLAQSGELGGFGAAPPPVAGGLDVYEGFAEVIAPIVSDRPFFDELQVEAGIRRSHYTVAAPANPKFNTTTWKVAGSWAPVHDLKFRGAYNRAVRAPNISELFTPLSNGLTNLAADPCAGSLDPTKANFNANLNNPQFVAICIAQGAAPGRIGQISNPTAGQANATFTGSLALRPEKATTWTVGAVIRPRWLTGFSASVDYYNIRVDHAITAPTPGDAINACFANVTAASASSLACTQIRRNPASGALDGDPNQVPGLFLPLTNQGKITTDGVDVTFDYRRSLGTIFNTPAKLSLNFGGNWTHSQKFQAISFTNAAFPTQSVNRECAGYFSANCGFPSGQLLPKISWNQRTTLSLGRVDLSVLWRHIGKMKYEGLASDFAARGFTGTNCLPVGDQGSSCTRFLHTGPIESFPSNSIFINDPGNFNGRSLDFNHIKAFDWFDFSTRFNVNEHFDLTFTINNILDKKPPVVGNTAGSTSANSGNTFPATYDPLGRRFTAGARIKF
jgi:outer membrane receptor protein involved in Fe transport